MPEFVPGPNGDLAALRGEFAGVLKHVPEHLRNSGAVDENMGLFRAEVHRYPNALFCGRTGAIIVKCVLEQNSDVNHLPMKIEFTASDSIDVQQIVNESCLNLNIATNHL